MDRGLRRTRWTEIHCENALALRATWNASHKKDGNELPAIQASNLENFESPRLVRVRSTPLSLIFWELRFGEQCQETLASAKEALCVS